MHKKQIFRLLKTSLELQVNYMDHDMNNGRGQRVTLVIHTIIQVIRYLLKTGCTDVPYRAFKLLRNWYSVYLKF